MHITFLRPSDSSLGISPTVILKHVQNGVNMEIIIAAFFMTEKDWNN